MRRTTVFLVICSFLIVCTSIGSVYFSHQARIASHDLRAEYTDVKRRLDEFSTKLQRIELDGKEDQQRKTETAALLKEYDGDFKQAESILDRDERAKHFNKISDGFGIAMMIMMPFYLFSAVKAGREGRTARQPQVDDANATKTEGMARNQPEK